MDFTIVVWKYFLTLLSENAHPSGKNKQTKKTFHMEYYQQAIENNKKIQNNRGERKKKTTFCPEGRRERRQGVSGQRKERRSLVRSGEVKVKWISGVFKEEVWTKSCWQAALQRTTCCSETMVSSTTFPILHTPPLIYPQTSPGSGCLFVFTLILFIRLSQSLSALFFHSSLCHSFNISPHLF